jgi:ribosomal protein L40E
MGNPSSHQDFRHTCPTCNRPVRHGDKFCEVCGAKIPSLATCSKCGTQFIHPKKFCDLCGAPFILEEIPDSEADEIPETGLDELPEPDSSHVPEPDEEKLPEAAEEELPGQAEEEIPEADADETDEPYGEELPEAVAEEVPGPDEEEPSEVSQKTPIRYKDDALEPDTAELLEQFGEEYGDDETLESFHTAKPPSPIQPGAKKGVMIAAPQRQELSRPVDDALFLVDGGPTPAKPPVNKIWIIGGGIGLVIILAVILFIGLPLITGTGIFTTNNNPISPEITPVPIITTPSVKFTPASGALVPQPTESIPTDQKIFFQVRKDPITSKISVIFTGPAGAGSISGADVKVTHPDGSVTTGSILPLKGLNEVTIAGSKETDRVEIIAKMSDGKTYRVFDDLVPSIR